MNSSLHTADRVTHLKIVTISALAALVFVVLGSYAGLSQSRDPTMTQRQPLPSAESRMVHVSFDATAHTHAYANLAD